MARAKAPATSPLARSAIAGAGAARIGLLQLGHRLRRANPRSSADAQARARVQHEAALGRVLFQTLSQLRGSALKIAQLLSLESGLLPEVVRSELARACHQVPALNRALVGRVFRQSFGCEPQALFTQFAPSAFAAASLGQVHRAELAGHGAVAVKLQYPGIGATIAADMRLVRAAFATLGAGGMVLPAPKVSALILDEIEATLLREVDYRNEAAELLWFARHAAWPGVRLPRPIASHSSAQVLTQTLLDGVHLHDWLRSAPTQAERNRQGQRLLDWFLHCAFGLGRVQSDLHPGNVLFLRDGCLGLLDFGCTRALSPGFRSGVAQIWSAWLHGNPAQQGGQLLRVYRSLGMIAPELPDALFLRDLLPLIAPMLDWQTQALRTPRFDFRARQPPPRPGRAAQQLLVQHLAWLPAESLAFERAWYGLMQLLGAMQAQVGCLWSAVSARLRSDHGQDETPRAPDRTAGA